MVPSTSGLEMSQTNYHNSIQNSGYIFGKDEDWAG